MDDREYTQQLTSIVIDEKVLTMIPDEMIRSRVIFPVAFHQGTGVLTIVTSHYADVVRDIQIITQVLQKRNPQIERVEVFAVNHNDFEQGYQQHFGRAFLNSSGKNVEVKTNLAPSTKQTQMAQQIIKDAVDKGASDIHIIPGQNGTYVKFRIDGKIYNQSYPEITIPDEKMISNIYKQSCAIERIDLIAQDGHFNFIDKNFRFNSEPYGDKTGRNVIAIRVSSGNSSVPPLEKLGFKDREIEILRRLIMKPSGIILVCGPTGEGKSTTQSSMLDYLQTQKNLVIITFEDPIEILMEGVGQCQIREVDDENMSFSFEMALRAALRQDPDVIQIGEIRDKITAAISVQASQTGLLIVSTIHVRNSISVFRRLGDMGANVGSFTEQVAGVVSQRLLSTLCPKCKHKVVSDFNKYLRQQDLDMLEEGQYSWEADGCPACKNTGIGGRVPLVEIIEFNNYLRDFFSEKHGLIETERFLRENTDFLSLWDKGMELVTQGVISLKELVSTIEVDEDLYKKAE